MKTIENKYSERIYRKDCYVKIISAYMGNNLCTDFMGSSSWIVTSLFILTYGLIAILMDN
jgi:hypothetical protein